MDISFAWTTRALLAGKKKVTRRDWSDAYARRFPPGSWHWAVDKQRRFGGRVIGRVRIVSIKREPLSFLVERPAYGRAEIRREGGLWESPEHFVRGFVEMRFGDPYRVEFRFEPATEPI